MLCRGYADRPALMRVDLSRRTGRNRDVGFKLNGMIPANLRVRRWEARAEECRTLTEQLSDPHCRQQLTRLAATYDRMALQHQPD